MNFNNVKERIAWLGRMPKPLKFLFGSQALVVMFLVHQRRKIVEQHNNQFENEDKIAASNAVPNGSHTPAEPKAVSNSSLQSPKSALEIYNEMMSKKNP
jgi:hypothetical protein